MKDASKTKAQLLEELESLRAEQRRAESTLRQRTDDLLAVQKKLDALTSVLADSVREPVGRIVSFAQMLEEDYAELSDDHVQFYLRTIVQRGREMVDIIDRLLMVRAGPSKEIKEGIGPLDMAPIVKDVLWRLARMATECQAEIIAPDSWPVAMGHGPWVEEVWANLINNAIRYGGQPPRVELGATPLSVPSTGGREKKRKMVRFWVRDNGPGLAPEEQVRLFTRPDRDPVTEYGLGLVLVQRIMERLGGEVGVESELGQGSVFYFTLPAVEE
jgi:signal transduction histidine kinase